MKKYGVIGVIILICAGLFFIFSSKKNKDVSPPLGQDQVNETKTGIDMFANITDMCVFLSKETISNLLGKPIIKTSPTTTQSIHSCQYYISETQAVIVNVDSLSVDNQKKGHVVLGRTITTNPAIPMDHFIVIQENGLINEIYLVLSDHKYIAINRTSSNTISETETITFAAKLAGVVTGKIPFSNSALPTLTITRTTIPLPQETDSIQSFLNLIREKKPSEAVGMMKISNDSEKQAWAVQFNAISSLKIVSIEPSMQSDWTNFIHSYKVSLELTMKPESATAPIPYYGWENGQNTRWIQIEKVGDVWKIAGIATGP